MATIVIRAVKGSALTHTEMDNNFTNLNTDKAELGGAVFTGEVDLTSTFKINGTTVTPTAAELNHSDGVTSAIQTQLNTITASNWVTQTRLIDGAVGSDKMEIHATTEYFTSSGTFTAKRTGLHRITIVAGGGGGGGGDGVSSPSQEGGGGGGAGKSRTTIANLTDGNPYTVTIGSGGAGGAGSSNEGANGIAGTSSSFDGVTSPGGAVGSGGVTVSTGGDGEGAYSFGFGGTGGTGGAGGAGAAASGYGAAGGGGGGDTTGTGGNGAAGVDGIVIIEW